MFIDTVVLFQLLSVGLSWGFAQVIKGFLGYSSLSKKSFLSTSGGMPSAHTASAAAFLFSELFFHGLTSLAGLSLIVLGVISVDAMGVRYAVGVNSKVLSKTIKDKKLKQELILKNGHTKLEVFAGIVLALVVSFAIFFVFGALV